MNEDELKANPFEKEYAGQDAANLNGSV